MPHALLLAGDQLAQTLAVALGRNLLCSSAGSSCSGCQSCQWVSAASHPDLILLQPDSKSGQIVIAQTRELARNATLTAAGRRIFIIDPAHAMNRAAANSLLKTLEEPPGSTLIILCSARPGALPATIRSRCQTLLMPKPSRPSLKAYLLQICQGLDEERVERLLTLSHGSVDDALELVHQGGLPDGASVEEELKMLRAAQIGVPELAAKWIDGGHVTLRLRQLARHAQQQLRCSILEPENHGASLPVGDLTSLWSLYDATNRCRSLLTTSARSELQLEALLLKWRDTAA